MDKWNGRVALVTGASSGIGADICKELVKCGMRVVGAARREDSLKTIAASLLGEKGELIPFKCDVTQDAEVYSLFEFINKNYGGVDICINSAGMSGTQPLLDGEPDKWRNIFNLNVVALMLCTKLAVKSMEQKSTDDGYIINIGSIAGHYVNLESLHCYAASKFAVRAATDGFRQELRRKKSGIRISLLSPGMIRTPMTVNAQPGSDYAEAVANCEPILTDDTSQLIMHMLSMPGRVEINDILLTPTVDFGQ